MLKESLIRRIFITTLALIILLLICFFPDNNNYQEELTYHKASKIPIFLIDDKNYVARTSILKTSMTNDDLIKEIIDILTINSLKSVYIPNGFKAIIPKDTKLLDIKLENNLLSLNFSQEFLNIENNNEDKLLEALLYSLTELKEVQKISLFVEGKQLLKLPSGKKIPKVIDKTIGINKIYNISSLKDTTKTTIYYLSKNDDFYYYIPITMIDNRNMAKVEIIIKELKTTPIYQTNLISYLATNTNLTNYELLENKISLSFDNYLLANLDNKDILEEVKYSLVLSLRDTYNVQEVSLNILNNVENFKV